MEIKQIVDRDEIPELIKLVGGGYALEREIFEEFDGTQVTGNSYFVRFEHGWLQRIQVDPSFNGDPMVERKLFDHKYWELAST